MNIPYVFKRCSKCGEWKVASTVNFYKKKDGKYGLNSRCKKCSAEYKKQHYENNKDKILEYKKQYYGNNKDKILEYKKQYYENNKDKLTEQHKQYYENNKDKILEHSKQYRENNKDKRAKYQKQYYENNKDKLAGQHKQYRENNKDKLAGHSKQYYENNKDKILEYSKQYYENNKDKILEYSKQYRENNKDKIAEYFATPQGQASRFNNSVKRRLREQSQGKGITKEQWLECMKFFGFRCAYSGQVLSKDIRSLDHIVPLNKGGEHEIFNLAPMYRPYNSSKQDKDLLEWYKEQDFYSEERLQKIYEWQEYAFNKWGYEILE